MQLQLQTFQGAKRVGGRLALLTSPVKTQKLVETRADQALDVFEAFGEFVESDLNQARFRKRLPNSLSFIFLVGSAHFLTPKYLH
jgi:hypothetical protein